MIVARRFNAGMLTYNQHESRRDGWRGGTGFPPWPVILFWKARLSLRDWSLFHILPGVETPGYCQVVPLGQWAGKRRSTFLHPPTLSP